MGVRVPLKKQFLFGIMLLVVVLVVVEGLVNIWWYQVNICAFENNELFKDLDNEAKRQLCLANFELQVTERGIEPNQKSSSIHINNEGFRGPEITKEKPDGTYRIFLVGGSTAFGSGVKDDETPSAHLQKIFDDAELDFKVEVINAGIPGAWSKPEIKFVKDRLIEYDPDLFIIYDGVNDLNKVGNPQGGPVIWKERWLEICNMGKDHSFDTIISIQPILGTGKRIPTEQENPYLLEITNSGYLEPYPLFIEQLDELDIFCTATADFRGIFDNVESTIFFDQAHLKSKGNAIVAEAFYKTSLPIVLEKASDIQSINGEILKSQENTDSIMPNPKNNLIIDDSVNTLRKLFLSYKTPRVISNLLTVFSYEIPQQTISDQEEIETKKQSLISINFNEKDLLLALLHFEN